MKRKNRAWKLFVLFALIGSMILPSANGYAATQKQKALNAYNKLLSKSYVEVLKRGYTLTMPYDPHIQGFRTYKYKRTKASEVRFGISYIDSNDVPELIIQTSNNGKVLCGIFTYKKGKICRIFEGECYSYRGAYGRSGVFTLRREGESYSDRMFYKLNRKKASFFLERDRPSPWFRPNYYDRRHKEISKYQYNRRLKKETKGRSLKVTKLYKNTRGNRKKVLR